MNTQHLRYLANLSRNHTICVIPEMAAPDQPLQQPDLIAQTLESMRWGILANAGTRPSVPCCPQAVPDLGMPGMQTWNSKSRPNAYHSHESGSQNQAGVAP